MNRVKRIEKGNIIKYVQQMPSMSDKGVATGRASHIHQVYAGGAVGAVRTLLFFTFRCLITRACCVCSPLNVVTESTMHSTDRNNERYIIPLSHDLTFLPSRSDRSVQNTTYKCQPGVYMWRGM